jgi:hypothetical protein
MYAHFGEFGTAGPIAHADIFAIARGSKSRQRITRGSRGLKPPISFWNAYLLLRRTLGGWPGLRSRVGAATSAGGGLPYGFSIEVAVGIGDSCLVMAGASRRGSRKDSLQKSDLHS